MSRALGILQGRFGRVALLHMDRSLITHAHRACHILLKFHGDDTCFNVNGRVCPLTADECVLVNAWEPHAYTHMNEETLTVILALYIDPDWLSAIDKGLRGSGYAQFFREPMAPVTPEIRLLTQRLGEKILYGEMGGQADVEELVFDLTTRAIYRNSNPDQTDLLSGKSVDFRVHRAIMMLQGKLSEPLDVCGLARQSGLSRAHFFAQFKRVTGLSPGMYHNTLRMECATRVLFDSNEPLADVGHALGFDSHSNFTRFFRLHQGVSPSEYRRVTHLYD